MTTPPRNGRAFDRAIVDGPIARAVWKLAWPTMLQNVIAGLQGIVDHAMVGHLVGYTGNAAIGVSLQIFIVVIVFLSSLFTGMSVLVARFAGANEPDKVNRTVYQAFLASSVLCVGIFAPLGYALSPALLRVVNATAEVQAEALPYLRIMLVFNFGMMLFFMLGAALRSAGDARTPLRFGLLLTVLNVVLNVIFIRGLGPIPAFGTAGAAIGSVLSGFLVSGIAVYLLLSGRLVVTWPRGMDWRPDWSIIRSLFRFGLPAGVQGIAMNVGGVLLLRYIGSLQQSAQAQAAYAVGYTELFSLITWTSMGLMGAAATIAGQNLGANRPERVVRGVHVAAGLGLGVAAIVGSLFLTIPDRLLALFGMENPDVVGIGTQLLAYLSLSGLFITVALTYTGALQGTGDTRSPLYISIVSQLAIPLGLCAILDATRGLRPADIWLAIVLGHGARCILSVLRFHQEKWRGIEVDIKPAVGSAPPRSSSG
ncbi:MAG TPA: MATE family efflux transporter [Thermoanaerobaculia bacterium]|nr:MATE family efflux transporter [Thermoanaerobaculia bacterium]